MKGVLVIDIGGTNVKMKHSESEEIRKFPSGVEMGPPEFTRQVLDALGDWNVEKISVGYPGPIVNGRIHLEPANLGRGWVGFDFRKAMGRPVKLINDAAMQALGSYQGGRMLFLGLGTGLGTTFIVDGVVAPLEVGHLPYRKKQSFEQWVGNAALQKLGKRRWQKVVFDVVHRLRDAFIADYVVLGGGNVKKLDELPPGCRQGDNRNAFVGGERLWA